MDGRKGYRAFDLLLLLDRVGIPLFLFEPLSARISETLEAIFEFAFYDCQYP